MQWICVLCLRDKCESVSERRSDKARKELTKSEDDAEQRLFPTEMV